MAIQTLNPKITFIHIPKNGGSSVNAWALENLNAKLLKRQHDTLPQLAEKYGDLGYTWAISRNPFDRFVSQYHFSIQRAKNRIDAVVSGKKAYKQHKQKWNIEWNQNILDTIEDNFRDWLLNQKNWSVEWSQQHRFIPGVDKVIKIENLQSEFQELQKMYNCFEPLPHKNHSTHKAYQEYFDSETIEFVEKICERDLNMFDYSFN